MLLGGGNMEYVLNIYETMPKFNNYMRHKFPPDEMYIQTVLFNSPFKDRISDYSLIPREGAEWFSEYLNLTYFEYPVTVTIFDKAEDYKDLINTKALFVRKVTYTQSAKLLDEIDVHLFQENVDGAKT